VIGRRGRFLYTQHAEIGARLEQFDNFVQIFPLPYCICVAQERFHLCTVCHLVLP